MTDAVSLMAKRRSVNPLAMEGPAPTPDEVASMLTLATRVPDHGKLAPWRFIVFEGEARLRAGAAIAEIYAKDHLDESAERLQIERNRLARAPLVIGVVSRAAPHVKIPEWEQIMSAGAVCMNLTIAANALGYATSWLTEWYAYDRRTLKEFGVAENEKMAGFLHIGRAREPAEDRPRPNLAELVSHFA